MIMTIPMQLEEAQKEVKVKIIQINNEEFNLLKKKIFDNMGVVISDNSSFIWEQFVDSSNVYGEFAWEYIAELIPKGECYLFFNQIECKNAYLFQNSRDLCEVIGETYESEVYVTDFDGTYLISYNHEMVLSGYGKAKKWVENLKKIKNIM